MAADPQDAPRHVGQVVCRVLLRHTSPSTRRPRSSLSPPSRRRSKPVRPPGRRAEARAFPPPTASRCSDMASEQMLRTDFPERSAGSSGGPIGHA